MAMAPTQRIAAFGVAIRNNAVLMVRSGPAGRFPGRWNLPGGGVEHGEHPEEALVREFEEETGLAAEISGTPRVYSDVQQVPRDGELLHQVRLCWSVTTVSGEPQIERGDSTDRTRWVPLDQALALPVVAPFVTQEITRAAALGRQPVKNPDQR